MTRRPAPGDPTSPGPAHVDGHQARLQMLAKRSMPGNHGVAATPDHHSFLSVRGKSRRATLLARRAVGFPILRRPDADLQNIRQRASRPQKRKSATRGGVAGGDGANDHARSQGNRSRQRDRGGLSPHAPDGSEAWAGASGGAGGRMLLSACTTLGPDFRSPQVPWLQDWSGGAWRTLADEAPRAHATARRRVVAPLRRPGAGPTGRPRRSG